VGDFASMEIGIVLNMRVFIFFGVIVVVVVMQPEIVPSQSPRLHMRFRGMGTHLHWQLKLTLTLWGVINQILSTQSLGFNFTVANTHSQSQGHVGKRMRKRESDWIKVMVLKNHMLVNP